MFGGMSGGHADAANDPLCRQLLIGSLEIAGSFYVYPPLRQKLTIITLNRLCLNGRRRLPPGGKQQNDGRMTGGSMGWSLRTPGLKET